MCPENLLDKLNLEIRWLASHTDQAHPIPGIALVRRVINGRARTFHGEAPVRLMPFPRIYEVPHFAHSAHAMFISSSISFQFLGLQDRTMHIV